VASIRDRPHRYKPQGRHVKIIRGKPGMPGAPSSRQNPLQGTTEFYLQRAIKFVHRHENFRRKPLKGKGNERISEGKERARLDF